MPNYRLFSDRRYPVYVEAINSATNPTISVGPELDAARNGAFYFASTGSQNVAASSFLVVRLTNPSGSGRTAHLAQTSGGAITNTVTDLVRNATFTGGTELIPVNSNFAYSDASVIGAKYLSQATDLTTVGRGGGTVLTSFFQVGVVVDYAGSIILPPGYTMVIRLANITNQTNRLALNVSWWEL